MVTQSCRKRRLSVRELEREFVFKILQTRISQMADGRKYQSQPLPRILRRESTVAIERREKDNLDPCRRRGHW